MTLSIVKRLPLSALVPLTGSLVGVCTLVATIFLCEWSECIRMNGMNE